MKELKKRDRKNCEPPADFPDIFVPSRRKAINVL